MSYSEEDFDEKYEEYYRRYEEEEGPYVEGGLLSNENDYPYVPSYEEFMMGSLVEGGRRNLLCTLHIIVDWVMELGRSFIFKSISLLIYKIYSYIPTVGKT